MTELEFKNNIDLFTQYSESMRDRFFDYWSEPNKKGKMRWELEKTWDTKRRLKRWFDNQNKWNGNTHTIVGGNKVGTSEARINTAKNW